MNEKDIILQPLGEPSTCHVCARIKVDTDDYCCQECRWLANGSTVEPDTRPHGYVCNLRQTDVGRFYTKILLNKATLREYEYKLRIVEELSR